MANIRSIKNQIASVHSTQKVTGAMKMVSASKMRRTYENLQNNKPYQDKINELLSILLSKEKKRLSVAVNLKPSAQQKLLATAYTHPLMRVTQDPKNIALIVINSDKGLCGSFNVTIEKQAFSFIEKNKDKEVTLLIVGKSAYDSFRRKNYTILEKWINLGGKFSYTSAESISTVIYENFENKIFDELYILYNKVHSLSHQENVIERMLPFIFDMLPILPIKQNDDDKDFNDELSEETPQENQEKDPQESGVINDNNGEEYKNEYFFEPEPHKLLDYLLPQYLTMEVYHKLVESSIGEHKSRMVAMESATRNAEELVKKLKLIYNKARQAAITTDLLDIINGAEALR